MKILLIFVCLRICLTGSCQTYFDISKEKPCSGCENYNPDWQHLKHYKLSEINQAFDAIKKFGIEFSYPQGGCQNRAQIMSMVLLKQGIEHTRIWLFAPIDLDNNDKTQLQITDKNQLTPGNKIKWNYHVAPCALVDNNGKTDTIIMDPSLDENTPILLWDWLHKIENSRVGKYSILDSKWYFFLTQNNIITGEFYKFEIDNRYCGDNFRNLSMEKGLAINDLAIYALKKYITPLNNSVDPEDRNKLKELKNLFGNGDALTSIFGSEISYCGATVSDNLSYRYYFETYSDLMTDINNYYIDRLNYWVGRSKYLRQ